MDAALVGSIRRQRKGTTTHQQQQQGPSAEEVVRAVNAVLKGGARLSVYTFSATQQQGHQQQERSEDDTAQEAMLVSCAGQLAEEIRMVYHFAAARLQVLSERGRVIGALLDLAHRIGLRFSTMVAENKGKVVLSGAQQEAALISALFELFVETMIHSTRALGNVAAPDGDNLFSNIRLCPVLFSALLSTLVHCHKDTQKGVMTYLAKKRRTLVEYCKVASIALDIPLFMGVAENIFRLHLVSKRNGRRGWEKTVSLLPKILLEAFCFEDPALASNCEFFLTSQQEHLQNNIWNLFQTLEKERKRRQEQRNNSTTSSPVNLVIPLLCIESRLASSRGWSFPIAKISAIGVSSGSFDFYVERDGVHHLVSLFVQDFFRFNIIPRGNNNSTEATQQGTFKAPSQEDFMAPSINTLNADSQITVMPSADQNVELDIFLSVATAKSWIASSRGFFDAFSQIEDEIAQDQANGREEGTVCFQFLLASPVSPMLGQSLLEKMAKYQRQASTTLPSICVVPPENEQISQNATSSNVDSVGEATPAAVLEEKLNAAAETAAATSVRTMLASHSTTPSNKEREKGKSASSSNSNNESSQRARAGKRPMYLTATSMKTPPPQTESKIDDFDFDEESESKMPHPTEEPLFMTRKMNKTPQRESHSSNLPQTKNLTTSKDKAVPTGRVTRGSLAAASSSEDRRKQTSTSLTRIGTEDSFRLLPPSEEFLEPGAGDLGGEKSNRNSSKAVSSLRRSKLPESDLTDALELVKRRLDLPASSPLKKTNKTVIPETEPRVSNSRKRDREDDEASAEPIDHRDDTPAATTTTKQSSKKAKPTPAEVPEKTKSNNERTSHRRNVPAPRATLDDERTKVNHLTQSLETLPSSLEVPPPSIGTDMDLGSDGVWRTAREEEEEEEEATERDPFLPPPPRKRSSAPKIGRLDWENILGGGGGEEETEYFGRTGDASIPEIGRRVTFAKHALQDSIDGLELALRQRESKKIGGAIQHIREMSELVQREVAVVHKEDLKRRQELKRALATVDLLLEEREKMEKEMEQRAKNRAQSSQKIYKKIATLQNSLAQAVRTQKESLDARLRNFETLSTKNADDVLKQIRAYQKQMENFEALLTTDFSAL